MTTHLYFAFGSNLSTDQMNDRCPTSHPVAAGVLADHRIGFAGGSRKWRGGVATVAEDKGASVPGLLYRLGDSDLKRLDRCEGHPHRYRRERVGVVVSEKETAIAWTYILREERTAPSDAYLRVIAEGYAMIGGVVTDAHHKALAAAAKRQPTRHEPFTELGVARG